MRQIFIEFTLYSSEEFHTKRFGRTFKKSRIAGKVRGASFAMSWPSRDLHFETRIKTYLYTHEELLHPYDNNAAKLFSASSW